MHRNLFLSHWLYHRKDTHTHTFCLVLVPLPCYFPSKHLEQGQILWHLSTLCASTFLSTTRICNRANGWDKKPLSSYRCLALADQADLQVTFDGMRFAMQHWAETDKSFTAILTVELLRLSGMRFLWECRKVECSIFHVLVTCTKCFLIALLNANQSFNGLVHWWKRRGFLLTYLFVSIVERLIGLFYDPSYHVHQN